MESAAPSFCFASRISSSGGMLALVRQQPWKSIASMAAKCGAKKWLK